jgi:hypothetical protein
MFATHKASGDEEAERTCRKTIVLSAKQIETLVEAIEFDKETLAEVLKRECSVGNGDHLHSVERAGGHLVSTGARAEGLAVEFAAALSEHYQASRDFDSAVSRCGVPPGAYQPASRGPFARAELLLYLETGGALGRATTLETPTQLREHKRASLHHAAEECRAVGIREARRWLGIVEPTH